MRNTSSLSICQSFQITYFNNQQFSTVLMITLFEESNRDVSEKVSFRISVAKFEILFLTNISLELLGRKTCKILRYRSLKATRIFDHISDN